MMEVIEHSGWKIPLWMIGIALCLSAAVPLQAAKEQPIHLRFEHFGVEDGLSQSTINHVLQDQAGFLWVATDGGLNRYDGYMFKVYKQEPFNTGSLSDNRVKQVFQQRNGRIWAVTEGGLSRLNEDGGGFTRFPRTEQDPAVLKQVVGLFEDRLGRLWMFGSRSAGFLVRLEVDDSFTLFYGPDNPKNMPVSGMAEDREGTLWVATIGQGLLRYEADGADGETFTVFQHDSEDPGSLGSDLILNFQREPLLADDLGGLWISHGTGVDYLPPGGRAFEHIFEFPAMQMLRGWLFDNSGFLWVAGADQRLYRYDPENERTIAFPQGENARGIHDPPGNVSSALVTRSGVPWFATLGDGVCRYDAKRNRFLYSAFDPSDAHSLGTDFITGIWEDRAGTLWFGTRDKGLFKYSPARYKFRHYLHIHGQPKPLRDTMVWSIKMDWEGHLWVGTQRDGLLQINPARDQIINQYRPNHLVRSVFIDRDGMIWYSLMRTGSALYKLDPKSKKETLVKYMTMMNAVELPDKSGFLIAGASQGLWRYTYEDERLERIAEEKVAVARTVLLLRDGRIATDDGRGMVLYDPKTDEARHFIYDEYNRKGISTGQVMCFFQNDDQYLWISLYGGGLNRFDLTSETFRHYTRADGLPDESVYEILDDEDGFLWLSTNRGLARFDPKTDVFRTYDARDGLQSDEFNMSASFKAVDGEMFFGGVNGFNAFYPRDIRYNRSPPQVSLSAWLEDGRLIKADLASGSSIELEPDEPMLSFTYAGLDYVTPSKNQFAFRLQGFDDHWQYVGRRRRATYTNLPGGAYVMQVKAANGDGVWSRTPVEVKVLVKPHFYETLGFRASLVVALLALVALLLMRQRQGLQRRQEEALLLRDHMRKSEELEFARQLQLAMIPKKDVAVGPFEVTGQMITATEVGGDYFDFFQLDDSRLCIAYGDATGHGVAAGLVVGMVKLAATVWAMHPKNIKEMMCDLNQGLRKTLPLKTMGMGFGLAVVDLSTSEVEVCSSGMPYPYLFKAADHSLTALEIKGPPLGYLKQIEPTSKRVTLEPGDRLIFLSDGFSERFDHGNNLWGETAVSSSLSHACRTLSKPGKVAMRLIDDCNRFAGARHCDDDMTVVVLQRRELPVGKLHKKPLVRA